MIRKIVTQDLQGNTHIYRYHNTIYTYSIKASCKCNKCGKGINKTFSFEYYSEPEEEYIEELQREKEEWLAEEHICNKCLKESCKSHVEIMDRSELDSIFSVIKDRKEKIKQIREDIWTHCGFISDKIKGKVCIYKDKEYVISHVNYCDEFYIYGYKIDEKSPWYTTQTDFYISEAGGGYGGHKVVNAKFSDVIFTDEVFAERKERVKEANK